MGHMMDEKPLGSGLTGMQEGGVAGGGRTSSRQDRRHKKILWGSVVGGVVVVGATIAVVLGATSERFGSITGATGATGATGPSAPSTSAIVGAAAAELLAKFPAKSISAGSVQLGPNVAITSMTISKNSDGSFSGTGTVTIGGSVGVNVSATITDGSNWSLTVASGTVQPFKVGTTGISVDPSTLSGTIADASGTITWNLTGTTVTWPIATGASLTTNFSLGNTCPFGDSTKCPSGDKLYLGLPSGSLAISGLPTVNLAGGVTIDGTWARLEGAANASASLSVAGASVSMSKPLLTVWRGSRSDSYDPNMVMPDTSALSNGTNLELCGNFAITVPSLVNEATGGCLRWTPNGVVLGQVGLGSGMTLSGGTAPSGTSTDIKGFGWSTLSTEDIGKISLPDGGIPGAISFSGVATKLFPSTLSLGGKANLPGLVGSALGLGSNPLSINVTGQVTSNSIALQGTVPVTINFGNEPFKVSVQQMTLGLSAGVGQGLSMTLGTQSDVTLGYGSSARVVKSSLTLQAATAPAVGFTLSLSAIGTPGGGDTMDGLTPSTRLAHPSQATFLIPDMMGIGGLNLWSLTGQIGFQGGSPSLAYASTSYMDPNGSTTKSVMACTGTCDDTDWLLGNLGFDISYTNPCFAYSFTSNPGGGSLAIDGGVMKASNFQVGISPNGCSINAGGTTLSLPEAFAGFSFTAQFGSATVNVATQVSADGFVFKTSITNLTLGGFTLNNMSLNVKVTAASSQVNFDAVAGVVNFGAFAFHADMGYDPSGMNWNVTGDICTDTSSNHQYCDPASIAGGLGAQTSGPTSSEQLRDTSGNTPTSSSQQAGFKLIKLHFQQSGSVSSDPSSCATLNTAVDGVFTLSKSTYTLLGPGDNAKLPDGTTFGGSSLNINCKGIVSAGFGISFEHTSSYTSGSTKKTLLLSWANDRLQGSYSVQMYRHLDVDKKKCCGGYYHYNEDVYFSINVGVVISSTYASFSLSCHIDTGRLNGWLSFFLDTTGDFVGGVRISVDVPWSDSTYHVDWGNL